MSDFYTDDDVKVASRAITRQNMPHASNRLVDLLVEQGEWDHAARWVLDAVAPAIAARALREAADAYTWPSGGASKVRPWARRWLRERADDIERT